MPFLPTELRGMALALADVLDDAAAQIFGEGRMYFSREPIPKIFRKLSKLLEA
jgi:hypothetical protein